MEELRLETLQVAAAILPGFLTTMIRDFFVPSRNQSAFHQVMEALAFSVTNYVLVATAWHLIKGADPLRAPAPMPLYWLGSSSIVLGLFSGWIVGTDLHYRAVRWLRLTRRTGRADVWQDVFSDLRGNWLLVHTDDGRRVLGWAQYYSDAGTTPSLFLRQAHWVRDDGTRESVDGEGLLVTEATRIRYVEFLGRGEESRDDDKGQRRSQRA